MKRIILAILLITSPAAGTAEYPATLPQTRLVIEAPDGGETAIAARVAAEPDARRRGMQRLDVATVRANPLWFVFPNARRTSWHMRDVNAALVIAYVDRGGRVLAVERMEPGRRGYGIDEPIRYALEVAADEAESLGLEAGARIRAAEGALAP